MWFFCDFSSVWRPVSCSHTSNIHPTDLKKKKGVFRRHRRTRSIRSSHVAVQHVDWMPPDSSQITPATISTISTPTLPKLIWSIQTKSAFWRRRRAHSRNDAHQSIAITLDSLQKQVPGALYSITSASVNRYFKCCITVLDVYEDRLSYGTETFKNSVYKSHRQVVYKCK
jgi:hypothetical protein